MDRVISINLYAYSICGTKMNRVRYDKNVQGWIILFPDGDGRFLFLGKISTIITGPLIFVWVSCDSLIFLSQFDCYLFSFFRPCMLIFTVNHFFCHLCPPQSVGNFSPPQEPTLIGNFLKAPVSNKSRPEKETQTLLRP